MALQQYRYINDVYVFCATVKEHSMTLLVDLHVTMTPHDLELVLI